MGMEITVIDDSDGVGWAAGVARAGEVYMTDVTSMVSAVMARSDQENEYISRLNILDHGSPRGFEIGSDNINTGTLPTHAIELVKLAPYFDTDGFVHLQHCQIGQNTALMAKLAGLLKVPVYAGKQFQNPVYRLNYGATIHKGWLTGWVKAIPNPFASFEEYVRVDPDGTVTDPVDRP